MQALSKAGKKKVNRKRKQPLDVFFSPKTVAVIGATENLNTVGRTVLWNLVTSPFGGTVYPVNPKRPSVLGVRAYKSISEIPEAVDLVLCLLPFVESAFNPHAIGVVAGSVICMKEICPIFISG